MKPTANLLKIRLFAVAMGLLISASLTQGALIDNGGFTTDTETGLDWLDMYHTVADSYNSTLAAISPGGSLHGWRFATSAEFYGLIDAAVGSSYTPVGSNGYDPAIYSEMVTLVSLLGYTFDTFYEIGTYGFVDSSELTDGYRILFGYTYDGDARVTPAESGNYMDKNSKGGSTGSFLVRATSVPDTGSKAALLGVGVVVLAFARCRLG